MAGARSWFCEGNVEIHRNILKKEFQLVSWRDASIETAQGECSCG
jgi:hypothetical protein